MKIVVTDGYTLNPGDISWNGIERLGEVTIYDRTPPDELLQRCKDANIILTNKVAFTKEILSQLPALKCICVTATGYDIIDGAAAKEQSIVVCNVPAYGTASVAQHVFALLLELTNGVGIHSASTRLGGWQQSEDWCYTLMPLTELNGKIMGIIGFGNIGEQTARIAHAFGMKVVYYNPSTKNTNLAEAKSVEEVFSVSDVVSLHCPLKKDNRQFVNETLLKKMKRTAFLINTSRGGLIQEEHLANALKDGTIAGAALDVLTNEPPKPDNPLMNAPNCIITPHIAWMSKEARERVIKTTEQNIIHFMEGKPINKVNE